MTDTTEDGVFNIDTTPSFLETLVGEGKKYKTIEDLAKGYANLEPHVESVKRENAEMRAELEERLNVARLLREAQQVNAQPTEAPRQDPPAREPAHVTEQDLVDRIREVTASERAAEIKAQNVQTVAKRLVDVYGSTQKANEVITAKAAELGVSVQFLQDVAAQSPQAFFAQVGVTSQPNPTGAAPSGTVNPAALGNADSGVKPNTYAWYRELQRTDPKRYFTPRIQNQLMKDAIAANARGEDFYR